MLIELICPARKKSTSGNRITAERWSRILHRLGHTARIANEYNGQPCDLMIAMHARKSAQAVSRYRSLYPDGPLILALTGTDVYRDIKRSVRARQSLEQANRIVVLQKAAIEELRAQMREKCAVIYQSSAPMAKPPERPERRFLITVLGHLRPEKDPFRAAMASRRLPEHSRVSVVHLGGALSTQMAAAAERHQRSNPRYRWLGEVSHSSARRWLSRSHLMVLSSRMEGGANVLSEAIVLGTPVLASRIPGSVGILGERYPGLFDTGDTVALAQLMERAECDPAFYARLQTWCKRLAALFTPQREQAAWARLLDDLSRHGPS